MLETKLSPVMPLPRRPAPARRPDAPARLPRRAPEPTAALRPARPARPNRLLRSEARLMGVALATVAVLCALLVFYLAAYARLAQLGVQQAHLRVTLRALQLEKQTLQAQVAARRDPALVAAQVKALGMTPGVRLTEYIAAGTAPTESIAAGTIPQQGAAIGQADSQRMASRGH